MFTLVRYNGAISVKKDIVVLLDTGASMNDIQGYTIAISSREIAGILAKDLLKTLTANDRATVMGFDSNQTSLLSQIVSYHAFTFSRSSCLIENECLPLLEHVV